MGGVNQMCLYCQESINFRDHGPFSKEARDRIKIVHICTADCTHPSDQPPPDYPFNPEMRPAK